MYSILYILFNIYLLIHMAESFNSQSNSKYLYYSIIWAHNSLFSLFSRSKFVQKYIILFYVNWINIFLLNAHFSFCFLFFITVYTCAQAWWKILENEFIQDTDIFSIKLYSNLIAFLFSCVFLASYGNWYKCKG